MSWRLARSLIVLRDEIDDAFPRRSTRSDGDIGDAAHATRSSDHNPWIVDGRGEGVVSALDITDDDPAGADMGRLVEWLTKVSRDERIKYLIHRGRIYSSYRTSTAPAWAARPYSGPNAHVQHMHISVRSERAYYDDGSPWGVAAAWEKPTMPGPRPVVGPHPLRIGASGDQVKEVQRRAGGASKVDGVYGPRTAAAVRAFQKRRRLPITGVVDQATARRLGLAWASR
jgi:hypothetical protein